MFPVLTLWLFLDPWQYFRIFTILSGQIQRTTNETFAWNTYAYFLGKVRKHIQTVVRRKFYSAAQSVNCNMENRATKLVIVPLWL